MQSAGTCECVACRVAPEARCPQSSRVLSPGPWRRAPAQQPKLRDCALAVPQAEACRGDAHPAFAVRSAEALLREAGAVCRSALVPAPFPQARSPFGVFPSLTAVPRHRGHVPSRCLWRRCCWNRACRRLAPSPGRVFASRRPASPGPCSMNESVAMSARVHRHHPILPWASLAPANPAAPPVSTPAAHPPRVAGLWTEVRWARAAARRRRLCLFMCAFTPATPPGPKLDLTARTHRSRPRSLRCSRVLRPKSKPAVLTHSARRRKPPEGDACPGASTRVDPACGRASTSRYRCQGSCRVPPKRGTQLPRCVYRSRAAAHAREHVYREGTHPKVLLWPVAIPKDAPWVPFRRFPVSPRSELPRAL